jgi:predicted metal-dependent peptidase
LSVHSNVKNNNWTCDFCNFVTIVDLDEEERPKEDVLDYMLEPGKQHDDNDTSLVVFCVDISGSMCVTSEIDQLMSEWAQLRGTLQSTQQQPDANLNPEGLVFFFFFCFGF